MTVDELHPLLRVLETVRSDVFAEREASLGFELVVDPAVQCFEIRDVVENVVGDNGVELSLRKLFLLQIQDPVFDDRECFALGLPSRLVHRVGREVAGDDRSKLTARREGPFEPARAAAENERADDRPREIVVTDERDPVAIGVAGGKQVEIAPDDRRGHPDFRLEPMREFGIVPMRLVAGLLRGRKVSGQLGRDGNLGETARARPSTPQEERRGENAASGDPEADRKRRRPVRKADPVRALFDPESQEGLVGKAQRKLAGALPGSPSFPIRLGNDDPGRRRSVNVEKEVAPLFACRDARRPVDPVSGRLARILDPGRRGKIGRRSHRGDGIGGASDKLNIRRCKGPRQNVRILEERALLAPNELPPAPGKGRLRVRDQKSRVEKREKRTGRIVDSIEPVALRHAPERIGLGVSGVGHRFVAARIFELEEGGLIGHEAKAESRDPIRLAAPGKKAEFLHTRIKLGA